jgi:prepilin-type processing-associated H-X9-DG protein
MTSSLPRCKLRAFTLVELLAVLGIITVLVAILLPALNRAREQANRVKCAANLRSMGQALTMYTQQYGRYPGCFVEDGRSLPKPAAWPVRLRPFLSRDQRVFYCPSQDERCEWTGGAAGPVELAHPFHVKVGYDPGERLITVFNYFSYGYNGGGSQGTAYNSKGLGSVIGDARQLVMGYEPELKASRVKKPAEMVAIADATADGLVDAFVGPSGNPGAKHYWPARIHGGGANVLFCDGHVTWYLQKDLLLPQSGLDPTWLPKARIWNYDHEADPND